MPTGYVYKMLDDNQSFEQFLFTCARAFGALIMMRDESLDAPIPERFEPDDYHKKEQARCEAELERLSALSAGELREWAMNTIRERISILREGEMRETEKNAKCRAMLAKVEKWQAPTPDHENLKKFMVEQLTTSMGGVEDYYKEEVEKLQKLSSAMFAQEHLSKLRRDIEYHRQHYAEEVQRTEERNGWIAALRESVSKSAKKNRTRKDG